MIRVGRDQPSRAWLAILTVLGAGCARPGAVARAPASPSPAPVAAPGSPSLSPAPAPTAPSPAPRAPFTATIALGDQHSCAIVDGGEVLCWGRNEAGQLGRGRVSDREPRAQPVPGLAAVVELAAGDDFTCARRRDGEVRCWGRLPGGNALFSGRAPALAPTPILAGARHIVATGRRACALAGARDIVCWGDAGFGDLGDGSHQSRDAPVAVAVELSDVAGLAVSYGGGCAWSAAGEVECWGRPYLPLHGAATRLKLSLPGLVRLGLGAQGACALLVDGRVRCSPPLFGASPRLPTSDAPPVPGVDEAVDLVVGGGLACALGRSRPEPCWSLSSDRAPRGFGDVAGATPWLPAADGDPRSPGDAAGATRWVEIAIALGHRCARRDNGQLLCWGHNAKGQVGDGGTRFRRQPWAVLMPGEVLVPEPPPPEDASCDGPASCAFSGDGARCVRADPDAPSSSQPFYVDGDAYCACEARVCRRVTVEAAACRRAADCWVSDGFPYRAVARPKGVRRAFRPCHDGDRPPICVGGRCALGTTYGC